MVVHTHIVAPCRPAPTLPLPRCLCHDDGTRTLQMEALSAPVSNDEEEDCTVMSLACANRSSWHILSLILPRSSLSSSSSPSSSLPLPPSVAHGRPVVRPARGRLFSTNVNQDTCTYASVNIPTKVKLVSKTRTQFQHYIQFLECHRTPVVGVPSSSALSVTVPPLRSLLPLPFAFPLALIHACFPLISLPSVKLPINVFNYLRQA
jgi:hypothetical protein